MQRVFRLFNLCVVGGLPLGRSRVAPEYSLWKDEESHGFATEQETEVNDEICRNGWLNLHQIEVDDLDEVVGLEVADIIALEDAFIKEMDVINNASLQELIDMIAVEAVRIIAREIGLCDMHGDG